MKARRRGRARRLQALGGRLVVRRSDPGQARRRCRADGDLALPVTRGSGDGPFGPLSQYTSWLFGNRRRSVGLLGSIGSIRDCYDNSWPRPSPPRCSSSGSTRTIGEPATSSPWRSSTGSRLGTTRTAGTATATASVPSSTRPRQRRDTHTRTVRHIRGLPR